MGRAFWIKRFLTVSAGSFVVISAAQMLKGNGVPYSISQGVLWGVLTGTVFTVSRYFQARRGQHCAICKDTPEMQNVKRLRG